MKRKLLVGIILVLIMTAILSWYFQGRSIKDIESLMVAERGIRATLGEYTEAIITRDAARLAEVMSYPADMGGVRISSKGGFISRMSHAFRNDIDELYDLSYAIKSIDVKPQVAVAEMVQNLVIVGYFGQPVELEKTMYMTFRKVEDTWKVADTGKLHRIDNSLLGRVADSPLTIPAILTTVLVFLGYIGSITSF